MSRRLAVVVALAVPAAALAQGAPPSTTLLPPTRDYPGPAIQSQPLPPPPGTASPSLTAPSARPAPAPSQPAPPAAEAPPGASPPPGQPPQAAPGQPPQAAPGQPPQVEAPPAPNPWLPQGAAVLQVLDKPDAQSATLTVKVGQSATYRSLTITVKACAIRPPDMPQNATAFLDITDSNPGEPGFSGWMLQSDPSLNMLQNPVYDVRVRGCVP